MGAASDEDSDVEEEEERQRTMKRRRRRRRKRQASQRHNSNPYDHEMMQLDPMPPLNAPPLSASDLLSLNVHRQELACLCNQNNPGVTLSLLPILPNTTTTQQL